MPEIACGGFESPSRLPNLVLTDARWSAFSSTGFLIFFHLRPFFDGTEWVTTEVSVELIYEGVLRLTVVIVVAFFVNFDVDGNWLGLVRMSVVRKRYQLN